jgi:hypothetical protein
MITGKQLAMIQAAKRQLALTEQEYRNLLGNVGGVGSARDLTPEGFTALIRAFEAFGFQRTNPPLHVRRGMATPVQLALVEALWRDYAGDNSGERLRHWLERSYKISALRFMTQDHAAMAINGLRVMLRRKAFQDAQAEKPSGAA